MPSLVGSGKKNPLAGSTLPGKHVFLPDHLSAGLLLWVQSWYRAIVMLSSPPQSPQEKAAASDDQASLSIQLTGCSTDATVTAIPIGLNPFMLMA